MDVCCVDEKSSLWIETASLTKVVVWNGTYGWHENCGCGHNNIHVIENSIKETTSCIIDCTDVWIKCDMQLQNNNLYCKVKKMEQKILYIG